MTFYILAAAAGLVSAVWLYHSAVFVFGHGPVEWFMVGIGERVLLAWRRVMVIKDDA